MEIAHQNWVNLKTTARYILCYNVDIARNIAKIIECLSKKYVEDEKMTKQRITLVSLAALVVFGLLLGGQLIYTRTWVDSNLLRHSREIAGVTAAKVTEVNGQKELDVTVDQVADLRAASQELMKLAGKMPIRLLDRRSAELTKLLGQMEFSLQEGLVRGNFVEMEKTVAELAAQQGVEANLAMDSEAVYLTLSKGSAQLVEVLERHGQGSFLASEGGERP